MAAQRRWRLELFWYACVRVNVYMCVCVYIYIYIYRVFVYFVCIIFVLCERVLCAYANHQYRVDDCIWQLVGAGGCSYVGMYMYAFVHMGLCVCVCVCMCEFIYMYTVFEYVYEK